MNQCYNCQLCSNLVESRKTEVWKKPVYGSGNLDSKIMFIGEAPGRLGAGRTGIPFKGDKSGDLLYWCFDEVVKKPLLDNYYITNIVKCLPKSFEGNTNRTPTRIEIRNCLKKHLIKEIDLINPDVLICLGRKSYDYLSRIHYNRIYLEHPAYILRNGGVKGNWKAYIYAKKIKRIIENIEKGYRK